MVDGLEDELVVGWAACGCGWMKWNSVVSRPCRLGQVPSPGAVRQAISLARFFKNVLRLSLAHDAVGKCPEWQSSETS